MFPLFENQTDCRNSFQKVKEQVESIKMILRCGICCSTLRDPIMTTCNHAFCRICLFECFKRLSLMRCPICNMTLNKRSCASCPLLSSALGKYLELAKAFKKDILATDFVKENDFIESQIPVTQAVLSPVQLSRNQSRKLLKDGSKSAKRHITSPQQRPKKMQRVDGEDYPSLVTKFPVNGCPGTSVTNYASCDVEDAVMGRSSNSPFIQIQKHSEEFNNGEEKIGNIGIQTDETEIQNRNQQISMANASCSPIHGKELNFNDLALHCEEILKENSANRTFTSVQMETFVNAVLEKNENQSRIEVLINCMPWIPDFLDLSREELISAVHGANTKKEFSNENSPSKNGIDLVLESDDEVEVTIPGNVSYTIDCCPSGAQKGKDHHTAQNIVSLVKKCFKKEDESCYLLMVSGASKLSDQSLLREFLDFFPAFKLSSSISRKCTHLIVFNTNGLICEFWTIKLIYALVNHCIIVSSSWLEKCLKQKVILPTDSFEISLKINETVMGINEQRALIDRKTLFSGYIFYVPQTFFNTRLVTRDVFLELIQLSGGKIVSHVWELPSELSYIIFAPDCLNQDAARRFELDVKKEVLTADWIFASIVQHRVLDREPYRLFHSIS